MKCSYEHTANGKNQRPALLIRFSSVLYEVCRYGCEETCYEAEECVRKRPQKEICAAEEIVRRKADGPEQSLKAAYKVCQHRTEGDDQDCRHGGRLVFLKAVNKGINHRPGGAYERQAQWASGQIAAGADRDERGGEGPGGCSDSASAEQSSCDNGSHPYNSLMTRQAEMELDVCRQAAGDYADAHRGRQRPVTGGTQHYVS